MPGLSFKDLNRRDFLTTTVKYAGVAMLSSFDLIAQKRADFNRLALISDTHIPADDNESYREFFPTRNFRKVVKQVAAAKPEASIINGDLARLTGEKTDYVKLFDTMSPLVNQHPVLMTLGNHDHRENFFEAFKPSGGVQELTDKHTMVYQLSLVKLILLDSLMYVNKTPGFLGQKQREWLRDHLSENSGKPTFIFVHHTLDEKDSSLLDFDRLFKIILPHKNVKAIFYGHAHRYSYQKLEDLHVIGLPAVGYNFNDDQPVGWLDARFFEDRGEFTLNAIDGNLEENGKTVDLVWR